LPIASRILSCSSVSAKSTISCTAAPPRPRPAR
jgi:hypothetical protein